MKDFSAFLDRRRYKNWAHKTFWKFLSQDLFCQFFPEHRAPHSWSAPWIPCRGCWKSAAAAVHDLTLVKADGKCQFVVDTSKERTSRNWFLPLFPCATPGRTTSGPMLPGSPKAARPPGRALFSPAPPLMTFPSIHQNRFLDLWPWGSGNRTELRALAYPLDNSITFELCQKANSHCYALLFCCAYPSKEFQSQFLLHAPALPLKKQHPYSYVLTHICLSILHFEAWKLHERDILWWSQLLFLSYEDGSS